MKNKTIEKPSFKDCERIKMEIGIVPHRVGGIGFLMVNKMAIPLIQL